MLWRRPKHCQLTKLWWLDNLIRGHLNTDVSLNRTELRLVISAGKTLCTLHRRGSRGARAQRPCRRQRGRGGSRRRPRGGPAGHPGGRHRSPTARCPQANARCEVEKHSASCTFQEASHHTRRCTPWQQFHSLHPKGKPHCEVTRSSACSTPFDRDVVQEPAPRARPWQRCTAWRCQLPPLKICPQVCHHGIHCTLSLPVSAGLGKMGRQPSWSKVSAAVHNCGFKLYELV